MSSDEEGAEAFVKESDQELKRREEEQRMLEILRQGIGFGRKSLMRTPPTSFSAGRDTTTIFDPLAELPVVESPVPALPRAKRPLSSPQESEPMRRRQADGRTATDKTGTAPPISGILSGPSGSIVPTECLVSLESPKQGLPPAAASTPEKEDEGLASLDKAGLIDEAYQAVKGISAVANATNKLNMADKGAIAGYSQDILAIVATLNIRLAEAEHAVTAMKLKVASMELKQSAAPTQGMGPGASHTQPQSRTDYAAVLKLPKGKAPLSIEPKGPAVLFYPASESIKSSEETLKELREKVQPAQRGIQVQGVRRVGNAGVVVQTATTQAAQRLREAAPPSLRTADPKTRRPLVAIRNLSGNPAPEEVLVDLHRVNLEEDEAWPLERVRREARFAFKKGRRGGNSTTVVYEVSVSLRDKLVGLGRVYVGWDAAEVCDYVRVTCCNKCQQYGHPEKHCRAPTMVCGKCGESGHKDTECQSATECCATCRRFKRPEAKNHRTASLGCPARVYAEKQAINMTQYA